MFYFLLCFLFGLLTSGAFTSSSSSFASCWMLAFLFDCFGDLNCTSVFDVVFFSDALGGRALRLFSSCCCCCCFVAEMRFF